MIPNNFIVPCLLEEVISGMGYGIENEVLLVSIGQ